MKNMKKKATHLESNHGQVECLCMGMGPRMTEMMTCGSEEAANHLRDAQIEFLKAMRAVLDDRMEHLSAVRKKKGTAVAVE